MLQGLRVVELGTVITAPLAGMMLADLGADVIKVERPEGDPFRRSRGDNNYSPNFIAFNRNKRSIALDLATEGDRDALTQLIESADVLLDNFRPGVLERLGLDDHLLRTRYPRLIHCSITGFGATGPYSKRPAFDAVAQSLSGMAGMFVDPEKPESFGPTISDNVTGMYAAYAILGALYERQKTGRGRRLEVNMLEASMSFITDAFATFTQADVPATRYSRTAASQSFAMRCADGKLLAIHLSTQDKFWNALIQVAEAWTVGADPRFDSREGRMANYCALQETLNEVFRAHPRVEWERRLTLADVPFAPVNTVSEVLEDPQVIAMGSVYEIIHPKHGRIVGLHSPVRADGERIMGAITPAPALNEHAEEIREQLRDQSQKTASAR